MKNSTKATFALLGTVLLWSYMVVISRQIVFDIDPVTVLFLRLLIASIFFLPFFIFNHTWKKPHFLKLLLISLGSTTNLTFFILGIKYTTASASQIVYAAMPILIFTYGRLILKEKQTPIKITGIIIGFLGLLLIGFLSAIEKGATITGTLYGNILISIAMLGWTFYLLTSKKISKYFNPIELGSTSILVSFIISTVIFFVNQSLTHSSLILNKGQFFTIFYIGFAGTFLTYLLYQYAVKHSSPLKVSLTSYIQPVTTAFLAILILGEKLTYYFIIGSIFVLLGVFFTSYETINLSKI